MRRYNIIRPIMLLAIAYFAYNLVLFISQVAGVQQENAENLAFIGAVVAAVITYMVMVKKRENR